ncbi:MAG: hypothetical protein JWR04_1400 [Rhodoglobus sp.]|nr:hypothetical protein [Rhodoglobus sp.]
MSELEELRRRAYGRPVSAADAAQAQAALQLLADRVRMPEPPPPVEAPAVASVPARGKLLLAAAAALATGIALAPTPSLDVFAADQQGVPAWPGAPAGDDGIRWLGSLGEWDVFGLITAGGNICVTAFADGASGGGSCTSRAAFAVNGLELGADTLTVQWGPKGEARLDDTRR